MDRRVAAILPITFGNDDPEMPIRTESSPAVGGYGVFVYNTEVGSIPEQKSFAGQWLAILPLALDWRYYIVAFVLFRLFDITKPWPCRAAERAPGGVGIMLDDIVAGLYAAILTWLIAVWLGAGKTLPTLFG